MSEPLHIEQGVTNTNGAMGSGLAWDERAVERFSV